MKSKGQSIGYLRVSTTDQNTARQLDGIELDRIFEDKLSGKNKDRPALIECRKYLREGDTLFVHSIDRLARDTRQLLEIVDDLVARGVTVEFVTNKLAFGADKSKEAMLMLTMLAAFADFEHSMIKERQREGIAAAKARGEYKKKLTHGQLSSIRARLQDGELKKDIAKAYGISRPTLDAHLKNDVSKGVSFT